MKLSQYAKQLGLTWKTAYRHFKTGQIKGAYQLPGGSIFVCNAEEKKKTEHNIVYARVSSAENRSNIDSQAERLMQFSIANGWVVHEVVKEIASGLNDSRPKLQKILREKKATRLIVEHKDRLTRFGFEYIKTLFSDCEIIIVNHSEEQIDLMEDFVSLVTSFSARLYGKRRSRRKTEKLIQALNEDNTKHKM
jgi:predicted site-specific integrase-resolvase